MQSYTTVNQVGTDFFVEKKSKFIGYCAPIKTEEEALAYIAEIKKLHWDASHNVYAYVLRGGLQRFSDDGEPQGKAGIPVLDVINKNGLEDIVVVATRYFGGIMLGGGGLIRAYSHTASIAIEQAGKVKMQMCDEWEIACGYDHYGRIEPILTESNGKIVETEFMEQITIRFLLPNDECATLETSLTNASNGRIAMNKSGERFCAVIAGKIVN